MKRKWHHPEEPGTGRRYFRSIAELEGSPESPEWHDQEFPKGVAEMDDAEDAEVSRRGFLQLMGGTTALAGLGLAGCRRPESTIRPFTEHVEWIVPGRALLYATAMPRVFGCTPLVATTHEGRPTHLQGNPLHPNSNGSTDAFATASIRELYDPGRSMQILAKGIPAKRVDFVSYFKGLVAGVGTGAGLAFVVGDSSSPTRDRLIGEVLKKFPEARFFKHEPISFASAEEAYETVLGKGVRPVPRLAKAKRVFALDSDFLGLEATSAGQISEFMSGRRPESLDAPEKPSVEGMNRLYVVESRYSLTGGMADHRKPLPAGQILAVAAELARQVGGELAAVQEPVDKGGLDEHLKSWIGAAAKDLVAHPGESLVLAGINQPAAVHALAAAINQKLGAYGKTAELVQTPTDGPQFGTLKDLKQLVLDDAEKQAKFAGIQKEEGRSKFTVIYLGQSNPVYDASDDLNWGRVHGRIENTVHLGLYANATATLSMWHVPAAHYLESWGDVRDSSGVYSVVQPMILPLFNGLSEIDIYLALLGKKELGVAEVPAEEEGAKAAPAPDPARVAVEETFATLATGEVEKAWNYTLRDGFLKGSKYDTYAGTADVPAAAAVVNGAPAVTVPTPGAMEVVLTPDASVWDGRHIENPWLQEAPDPISKVAWDNVAMASPRTLRGLNEGKPWKTGRILKLTVAEGETVRVLEVPAMEAPGHPKNSISISLGYGQGIAGRVGTGRGVNAYTIRTRVSPHILSGVTVEATEKMYDIVQTQEHYSIEGREIIREDTAVGYAEDAKATQKHGMDSHIPKNISLYKGQTGVKSEKNPAGFDYEDEHQWGMAIDLNSCTGCTACLVSCVSENNIPVVGKEQVKRGRVMHWIRMDRYFATTDDVSYDPGLDELDNPEMITQPVACQQCESAPCETVCPVNATVHTEEGLNAMAYNRCIGTRYCANNCPYKVRRFNFFDFNKRDPLEEGNLYKGPIGTRKDFGVENLQRNPNVTVRMRGVMEKCTYCVQRLETAKIAQKRVARDSDSVRVPTDSVKTACQQACPSDAIYFGDLADPNSTIRKVKGFPNADGDIEGGIGRGYDLLKYIGTLPRTSYLARIKNPNPDMPKSGDDFFLKNTSNPNEVVPLEAHGHPVERVGGASKWIQ